jgi:hypothetical protein
MNLLDRLTRRDLRLASGLVLFTARIARPRRRLVGAKPRSRGQGNALGSADALGLSRRPPRLAPGAGCRLSPV